MMSRYTVHIFNLEGLTLCFLPFSFNLGRSKKLTLKKVCKISEEKKNVRIPRNCFANLGKKHLAMFELFYSVNLCVGNVNQRFKDQNLCQIL
jgi:hypothetical protein